MTLKFGYRRSMADPQGLGMVVTKAKRFDKRRHWLTERGDLLRARDFKDEHLVNTVRFLRRRALDAGLSEAVLMDSMSDDAQMAMGSNAHEWITGIERYKIFPLLLREMKRRGLLEKDVLETKKAVKDMEMPRPATWPIHRTLYPKSAIPVRIESGADVSGAESLMWRFVGKHPTGTGMFEGTEVQPHGVGFSKDDLRILRSTVDEVLAGWK